MFQVCALGAPTVHPVEQKPVLPSASIVINWPRIRVTPICLRVSAAAALQALRILAVNEVSRGRRIVFLRMRRGKRMVRFATGTRQLKRTCKQDPHACAPGETSPTSLMKPL